MTDSASEDPVRTALSTTGLLLYTAGAAVVALAVLVTVVAPAEYGYDPTGVGQRLGLDALHNTVPSASVLWRAGGSRRSDSARINLAPGEGVEVKATMQAGQQLLFRWQSDGGPLHLEIHGDPLDSSIPYSSYWVENGVDSGEGGLTAPFDGYHGWYWRNDTAQPVVVSVDVEGYYSFFSSN